MTLQEGRQIPINTASKAQLRAFAAELGCSVTNFDNEDKLRGKITAQGYAEPYIIVPDGDGGTTLKASAKTDVGEVPEPMVTLTVHVQEGAGGKRPVYVSVNGRAILIPRNKAVEVKLRYLEALQNAIETKYDYDEELKANVGRDLPVYPYQVNKMPSDEAIAAWRAWEAAQEAAEAVATAAATGKKRAA